jgi:hypothetical protein
MKLIEEGDTFPPQPKASGAEKDKKGGWGFFG